MCLRRYQIGQKVKKVKIVQRVFDLVFVDQKCKHGMDLV